MISYNIKSLKDLKILRTAPILDINQTRILREELERNMNMADWFTVGIMASSESKAIKTLRNIEVYFAWETMKLASRENRDGPVFLKANQKTGDVHIRIEYGLGEGILLGCQNNQFNQQADTFGPFPLDFF